MPCCSGRLRSTACTAAAASACGSWRAASPRRRGKAIGWWSWSAMSPITGKIGFHRIPEHRLQFPARSIPTGCCAGAGNGCRRGGPRPVLPPRRWQSFRALSAPRGTRGRRAVAAARRVPAACRTAEVGQGAHPEGAVVLQAEPARARHGARGLGQRTSAAHAPDSAPPFGDPGRRRRRSPWWPARASPRWRSDRRSPADRRCRSRRRR